MTSILVYEKPSGCGNINGLPGPDNTSTPNLHTIHDQKVGLNKIHYIV